MICIYLIVNRNVLRDVAYEEILHNLEKQIVLFVFIDHVVILVGWRMMMDLGTID